MSIIPPRILNVQVLTIEPTEYWTVDDGTGDPWLGFAFRWRMTLDISSQAHSSHLTRSPFSYDGLDVKVDDWISDIASGFAVKIVEIEQTGFSQIVVIAEDVDRFNTFIDPTSSGTGVGSTGTSIIFQLGDDGLPVLGPMSAVSGALQLNAAWQLDQISRFRFRNYLRSNYPVHQADHGFNVGDLIRMTSTGYVKATASDTAANVVGSVSDINTPGAEWFTYRPVGRVVENLNPGLPGDAGDLVYLALDGSLTITKPNAWAKPVYIRLETENKGIVLDRSVDGVSKKGYSSQTYVVDSLAERNALTGLNPGDQAMVKDMGNGEWTHYLYEQGGDWVLMVTQDASNVDSATKQVEITYRSDPSFTIGVVSDGRRVDEVLVEITEAFDGSASISVGTTADHELLMESSQNDPANVGNYAIGPAHTFNTNGLDTNVKYYLSTSGSTKGKAIISITYS
jgi:hypothetical protein